MAASSIGRNGASSINMAAMMRMEYGILFSYCRIFPFWM
ncbi:hypothetical protein D1BOALGB6SA_1812 [Olavius sp. associated proteobacterium Delta 1]|nr:hypothetical protein D1BOALGB6SA_1812 [Olavius sp. associated proteobacterium Delta 1]